MQSPLDKLKTKNNILDRIKNNEIATRSLQMRNSDVGSLDTMAVDTGVLNADAVICGTGDPSEDPSTLTGIAIGYPGWSRTINGNDKTMVLVGEDNGSLKSGIANDGTLYVGSIIFDEDGANVEGTAESFRFTATNDIYTRTGTIRMRSDGSTDAPYLMISYGAEPSTSNIVQNNGFETGDYTNWTATPSTDFTVCTTATVPGPPSMIPTPTEGSYYSVFYVPGESTGVPTTDSLLSDAGDVTTADNWRVTFDYFVISTESITLTAFVNWYDSTGGYIGQTSILGGAVGTKNIWLEASANIKKIGAATTAKVEIFHRNGTGIGDAWIFIDNVQFSAVAEYGQVMFSRTNAQLLTYGETDNLARFPIINANIDPPPAGSFTVTASTSASTDRIGTGTYYYKIAYGDADGVTTPSTEVSIAIVDAQASSIITIDPTQTTGPFANLPIGADKTFFYRSDDGTNYYQIAESTGGAAYADLAPAVATTGDIPAAVNTTTQRPFAQPFTELFADMAIQVSGSGRGYNANVVTHPYDMYWAANAANSSDGDSDKFGIFLYAGTYTFSVLGIKGNVCGIIDWYLDDTVIVAGQDWYNAAASLVAQVFSTSNITVSTSGYHLLKFIVNGKNASSSDYLILLTKMRFVPSFY